ncbi:DUF3054 domain-containing protein [Thermomonospora sp. CIF 1]|uniref:DUF3054 domain-containing protein n=1 Tax=Thermomonospora sp. CIF 1 TaxID=1916083 RepID=UPI000CCB0F73|nr:DUF3054 domain-containing protein [Thermomonospora sp. CIF 1]PKK12320.1 MAG: hypothetical protein BUE48_018260 [Thermomonospora sp. CIF 1]
MRAWTAGGLDVVGVVAFVAIGRASHGESGGVAELAGTAWPFLAALAIGWAVLRAWRRPAEPAPIGLGVWGITLAGGMVLRALSGGGVAVSFVIVAGIFLALALIGWRAVVQLAERHGAAGRREHGRA